MAGLVCVNLAVITLIKGAVENSLVDWLAREGCDMAAGVCDRAWRTPPPAAMPFLAFLALKLLHALLPLISSRTPLTYHLPRAHTGWSTVPSDLNETAIARQNYQPRGSVMVICHLCALTGGDGC